MLAIYIMWARQITRDVCSVEKSIEFLLGREGCGNIGRSELDVAKVPT